MIAALSLLLPLSLGGAVSPMMLTEQTVLLGTGGRRAATHYAAGAVLTLAVFVAVLVFLGHAIELPTEPTLSASLDLVLGVGLIVIGLAIHYLGDHPLPRPKPQRPSNGKPRFSMAGNPEAAFPFGIFSMATNFTTLALVVVAAKEIAATDVGMIGRIVLVVVLVAVCSIPAWAPLAATRLAPRTGQKALDAFQRLIEDHGRTIVVALFLAAGAFLAVRGAFNV